MKNIIGLPWQHGKVFWKEIDFDNSPKVRGELREDAVLEFVDRMESGDKFPPPRLCENGNRHFFVEDGLHRLHATHRLGKDPIDCLMLPADYEACAAMALEENRSHGIRRSNADKRACVELASKLWPEKSNREIADLCGVHHDLVSDVRQIKAPKIEVAESASGKPARSENKPTASSQKPSVAHKAANIGQSEAPPKPAEKPEILDKTGLAVPKASVDLWNRGQEVQDALTMLSLVKAGLAGAQREKDTLYSEVNFSDALSQVGNAYHQVKLALPFAVCPTCQGEGLTKAKCRMCHSRGFVSEFRWTQQCTKEDRKLRELVVAKREKEKRGKT